MTLTLYFTLAFFVTWLLKELYLGIIHSYSKSKQTKNIVRVAVSIIGISVIMIMINSTSVHPVFVGFNGMISAIVLCDIVGLFD